MYIVFVRNNHSLFLIQEPAVTVILTKTGYNIVGKYFKSSTQEWGIEKQLSCDSFYQSYVYFISSILHDGVWGVK